MEPTIQKNITTRITTLTGLSKPIEFNRINNTIGNPKAIIPAKIGFTI